jgi:hypothetical protein
LRPKIIECILGLNRLPIMPFKRSSIDNILNSYYRNERELTEFWHGALAWGMGKYSWQQTALRQTQDRLTACRKRTLSVDGHRLFLARAPLCGTHPPASPCSHGGQDVQDASESVILTPCSMPFALRRLLSVTAMV